MTGIISSDTFHSDIVSGWKMMRIEYDRFSGINLPDTAWWVIEQVYSGFNFGESLDFNRTPYVEFREDTIHLLEDDSISPHPQIRWNYLHTDLKNVRDVYRSQVLDDWPFYLVAADSITGAKKAGQTYWPHAFNETDTTNMMSILYIATIQDWADSIGLSTDTTNLWIGIATAHELGHFSVYLADYPDSTQAHSTNQCLMNGSRFLEDQISEPRFCPKCIYYLRGNPRKRGPIVF